MEELRLWVNIAVVVATLLAVAFPVTYAFSTWNRSFIGRFLMADSIAYAAIMVITTTFRFWQPMEPVKVRILYGIAFTAISITNAALLYELWRINFRRAPKEPIE